jgi:hypothetical protein
LGVRATVEGLDRRAGRIRLAGMDVARWLRGLRLEQYEPFSATMISMAWYFRVWPPKI